MTFKGDFLWVGGGGGGRRGIEFVFLEYLFVNLAEMLSMDELVEGLVFTATGVGVVFVAVMIAGFLNAAGFGLAGLTELDKGRNTTEEGLVLDMYLL